jgi:HlyD family secretion protein
MHLCTRHRVGQSVLAVPVMALAALGAGCDRAMTTGAEAAAAQETSAITVTSRDFVKRVRLTGLTEATKFYVVTTPLLEGASRGSMVVIKLAGAGKAVKTGDLLVQFDSQAQDKAALDKRAEYEDLVQQIIQKRAEHDAARVKDESELTQARNSVKNFELETLKNEMLSRVLAEKNNQDLAEARSKVEALEEGFKLKRTAATSELRILEIKRDRAKAAMDHALENSKGMTVASPLDGLVVPKMTWRGNGPADIQEGDEMWPGAPVLQVVNQASMQVRARVNQADAPVVRPGMPVVVRLDAYPDLQMPGRLVQMAPIGVAGSFSARVRAFSAVVTIEGSNARLLPDLTAAIDVEVERVKNALVVPWTAVTREGDKASVRVREGNNAVARPITLGPSDEVDVVVTSGLTPGQVVLR